MELIINQLNAIENRLSAFEFGISDELASSYNESLSIAYDKHQNIERLIEIADRIPKENPYQQELWKGILKEINTLHYNINYQFDLDWMYTHIAHLQIDTLPEYHDIVSMMDGFPKDSLIVPVICSAFQSFNIESYWGNRHFICIPNSLSRIPLMYPLLLHELGHVYLHEVSISDLFSEVTNVLEEKEKNVIIDIKRSHGETKNQIQRNWILFLDYWEKWKIELFCDLFATYSSGPAYLLSSIEFMFPRDPFDVVESHPPLDLRIEFIIQALREMGIEEEFLDDVKFRWDNNLELGRYVKNPLYKMLLDTKMITAVWDSIMNELSKDSNWHFQSNNFNEKYHQLKSPTQEIKIPCDDIIESINVGWVMILGGLAFDSVIRELSTE